MQLLHTHHGSAGPLSVAAPGAGSSNVKWSSKPAYSQRALGKFKWALHSTWCFLFVRFKPEADGPFHNVLPMHEKGVWGGQFWAKRWKVKEFSLLLVPLSCSRQPKVTYNEKEVVPLPNCSYPQESSPNVQPISTSSNLSPSDVVLPFGTSENQPLAVYTLPFIPKHSHCLR